MHRRRRGMGGYVLYIGERVKRQVWRSSADLVV